MSNMFYNYDNDVDIECTQTYVHRSLLPDLVGHSKTAMLYNINKEPIGIEISHNMPATLYFNLVETSGQYLTDILKGSLVKFELITTNHKVAFEKTFNCSEVFNSSTNDIIINLSTADICSLRQESYNIKLTIIFEDGSYPLFSERDGLLVIR